MKIRVLLSILCFWACISCVTNPGNGFNQENGTNTESDQSSTESAQEFTKSFNEFGFSIAAPCVLQDVSSQSKGNFLANYGGVENEDDPNNMAAYQVAVIKIPIGVENYSKAEQDEMIDQQLFQRMAGFSNVKKILFSDNEYIGYVGDTHHNGLKQRGVMFKKDRYIIALTVLTNSDIERKFNKFTNSFKVID